VTPVDRAILRCPVCHSPVRGGDDIHCTRRECRYSRGFLNSFGQPVLIDFDNSIFMQQRYEAGAGRVFDRSAPESALGDALGRSWPPRRCDRYSAFLLDSYF